jgi:Glycosyl hydrolase-like 10
MKVLRRLTAMVSGSLSLSALSLSISPRPAQSSEPFAAYCQQSSTDIAQKDSDRKASLSPDQDAQKRYSATLARHATYLKDCRQQNVVKTEGIWLRLYPCDVRPGKLDEVLDRIVDRGYNQIFVETFFNGQVLLPAATNRTAWTSSLTSPGQENIDLLAEVIRKGHDRGLKVTSWMFALNVGVDYVKKPGKQGIVARNGRGQTTIDFNLSSRDRNPTFNRDEAFADPYHPTLRQDYLTLVDEVIKRRPDGIVFDYIRYPKGRGTESVADDLSDLWIFGEAAQTGFIQRATNQKGRELITRYLRSGSISTRDVADADLMYPQEAEPQWHGRLVSNGENQLSLERRTQVIQAELWRLAVGHAMQGVVDFVTLASAPVQRAGIPAGAVFFPDGNQTAGRGYDSRLQAWDRFPESIERYPMAYGVCGRTDCIMNQIQRVLSYSSNPANVKPVIAGIWQQPHTNRPPLEVQMQALRQSFPGVSSISHFAYSWQEPDSDRDRKFCRSR